MTLVRQIIWRRGLLLLLFTGALVFILFLLYVLLYPNLDPIVRTPIHDPALLADARNLLTNPEPETSTARLNISLLYDPYTVCVYYHVPVRADGNVARWSEYYLNNERVDFRGHISSVLVIDADPAWDNDHRCSFDRFAPGLYTLEVRLRYTQGEEPFFVHRWAFIIEV